MTPSTRALLAAAREGLGPDVAAAARVRAKLDALLAAPAAAAAAPASAATTATTGLAVKLGAAIAVATATAAVVVVVPTSHRTPTPTVASAPVLDEVAAPEPPAFVVHTAAREPAAPAPAVVEHAVRTVAPLPVAAPAVVEVSLAREVELIDDAMASLRAGHATDALAAIAAYHRETADHGQLTEEASAIDIEASCTLHLDVRSKLAAFDRTWPSSAQRARLTAACR